MQLIILFFVMLLSLVLGSTNRRKKKPGGSRARAYIRIRPSGDEFIAETAADDAAESINAFAEYGIALTQRADFALKESKRARRNADVLRCELDSEALTYKKRQTLEKQLATAERAEVKNNADAMRLYAQAQIQYAKARKMEEKAYKGVI